MPFSLLQSNKETPEQLLHQEPPDELLQADFMEVHFVSTVLDIYGHILCVYSMTLRYHQKCYTFLRV